MNKRIAAGTSVRILATDNPHLQPYIGRIATVVMQIGQASAHPFDEFEVLCDGEGLAWFHFHELEILS